MPTCLKKFFVFLLFSAVLYFISYFPHAFSNSLLANPSFYYLSTLVDKFDHKIQNLNLTSLKPKGEYNQDPFTDLISSSGEEAPSQSFDSKGDKTLSQEEGNTYFSYLLRILFRLLFLVFVQSYVFYILLFRYGELFKDLCDLSFKSLKDFNWRSPIVFMRSLYCFSSWLGSAFLYYNSLISFRYRLVSYSTLVLLISAVSFRAGFGHKRLLNTSPLVLGLTAYLSVLLTFNSKVAVVLPFLDNLFLPLWTVTIVLRGFKLERGDEGAFLELRADNTKLSHEASCTLDLWIVFVLVNLFKSIPVLGRLFSFNNYVAHSSLFFTMVMAIHVFLVYTSGLKSHKGTPLSGVRNLVLLIMNSVVYHIFGVPKFFSGRSRSNLNNFLTKNLTRVRQTFNLLFGRFLDPLNEHRTFVIALKFVKSIPQLFLLLLPPLFSRVYFEYYTGLAPISHSLSPTKNFREKVYCLTLLTLSGLARTLSFPLPWQSLRTLLRITLVFLLNHSLVLARKFIKISS